MAVAVLAFRSRTILGGEEAGIEADGVVVDGVVVAAGIQIL